jgi:CheY-like chemotaxis protein
VNPLYPSIFSLAKNTEWIEKLEEFFEETACHYKNYSDQKSFINDAQLYDLGFIETQLVIQPESVSSVNCIKLGTGEIENIKFKGRLDKKCGVSEIVKELSPLFPSFQKPFSVFLVDDDEDFCGLIKENWESRSKPVTEVRIAHNGLEGLEWFKKNPSDLLILDLKMPGLGGVDLYKQVRQQNRTTPVIVLSAVTDSEELKFLRRVGNPVCVEKSTTESLPDSLWWRALKLKVFGSRDLR